MGRSPRGACESCVNFIKVGEPHRKFFICGAWDWRSASSHTYTSCPYFERKKYTKQDRQFKIPEDSFKF